MLGEAGATDHARAGAAIARARGDGLTVRDEHQSKAMLSAYGIPTVETRVATRLAARRQPSSGTSLEGGA